ncbi:YfhE family protein [Cytobacillus kochii]|nr:YfhE family protein [Cytobacillus kochii]
MANDKKRKERNFSGLSSMQEVTYAKEFKRADRAAKNPLQQRH